MRRRLSALALAVATLAGMCAAPMASAAPRLPERPRHQITFDRYSLLLDGRRQFVWSGEFHPFRLPSPGLWRDVLQKLKASGYTAVSIYFDWDYHSPLPASTTSPACATWTGCSTSRRNRACT